MATEELIFEGGAFNSDERRVIRHAVVALGADPIRRAWVLQTVSRLSKLAAVINSYPSLFMESELAGHVRTVETLIDTVVKMGHVLSPLRLPVKAQLSRDFVIAKAQAFRAIDLAVREVDAPEWVEIHEELRQEVHESVYTLLIEEVLVDIVVQDGTSLEDKRLAGEVLVRYWEDSVRREVGDFCPELEAAWAARNRLVVVFGTLMGFSEVLNLRGTMSNPTFVDVFSRVEVGTEEYMAFEEFLFGLSFEQLNELRQAMRKEGRTVVDRMWVAKCIDMEPSELFSGVTEPEAMFDSYQQRHVAALFRRLRGRAGPRQTAEAILMIDYLRRHRGGAGHDAIGGSSD